MKIVLTGDNHLGKKQYNSPVRERDFQKAWLWVCDFVAKINPEFFIMAGDLFDRKQVDPVTLSVAVDGLTQAGGHAHVIAIEGNHDGRNFINKGRSWLEYLHEQGLVDDILRPGQGLALDCGIFFAGSQWAGRKTISAFENALWDIEMGSLENYLKVGVFHAAPEGYVMGTGTIPADVLLGSRFDLILMGHCHRPFNINDKVLCAGSPEICNIGEIENKAGIWVIDIDTETNEKFVEFTEYKPRDFLKLELNSSGLQSRAWGLPHAHGLQEPVVIIDVVGPRADVAMNRMREIAIEAYKPLLVRVNDKMDARVEARSRGAPRSFGKLVEELLAGSASEEEFNLLSDCFESDVRDGVIPILSEVANDS